MQNRYVGDIGDFGKYGLLKALAGDDLTLGIIWYLNAHEEQNADGNFTRYLCNPAASRLRVCDAYLFDALAGVVRDNLRTVSVVRERGLLPRATLFHEVPLPARALTPMTRRSQRATLVSKCSTRDR